MMMTSDFLTVTAMANFERDIAETYIKAKYLIDIYNCSLFSDLYATRYGCMKIYTDFTGSWNMANNICKQVGAHLWSVNSYKEWEEVLRSPKVKYYGVKSYWNPVNGAKYFRTSSTIFLGYQSQVFL